MIGSIAGESQLTSMVTQIQRHHLIIWVLAICCVMPSAQAQDVVQVDVMYPQTLKQSQTIRLPGTIQARHHARLATLESGRVKELAVEVGDVVSAGQDLLSLEQDLAELQVAGAAAEVKTAQLNLSEAQRLYDEVQRLSAQQVVAKTLIAERAALLANAETELARVRASHSLQQERLDRHNLQAPFSGVIAERTVDVGEWVTPQTPVLTLVAQTDLRLSIEVPQQHFHTLSDTSAVQVRVVPDAAGVSPVLASLSRLVPVSNVQTRTFTAQIDLPDDQANGLIPGMSATAELTFPGNTQNAIILPMSAIKRHPDGNSSVFVVENNRAKRLVTGFTPLADNQVAIYGLPADQAYIIKGVEMLKEGAEVSMNEVRDQRP